MYVALCFSYRWPLFYATKSTAIIKFDPHHSPQLGHKQGSTAVTAAAPAAATLLALAAAALP